MRHASTIDSDYADCPRWQRWLRCGRVMAVALPVWVRIERFVRQSESSRDGLPDVLATLADSDAPADLDPYACQTIAHRLVDRGRPDRCLPRALLLFGLLQRSPVGDIHFCLGVPPKATDLTGSFAHAWVEVNGRPFGEGTDPRDTHRLLFRYPTD